MSTVKANNVQVGQSGTATNNFTLYQPSTPDGTVRLAVGNSGATSADVLTANSSGNVGIGTSSISNKLEVNGSARFYTAAQGDISITHSGLISSITAAGSVGLALGTNNTEAMRINTSQGVQAANCISVGAATPSTSGAGITFPATQSASSDANTLDDYEEGTWTPAYAAATGSFNSITYGVRGGRYTKIGNTVTLWFIIQINSFSVGTASGNLTITGIPFNVASSVNNRSAGAVSNCNSFTTGNNPEVITSISSTSLSLYKRTSAGGAQSANQVSDLSNSCEFAGCFVYEAA